MPGREIRVTFRGLPSEAENGPEERVVLVAAGATVLDLLGKLAKEAGGKAARVLDPERGSLRPEFLLTLNGRFLERRLFATAVLQEKDEVEVFPVPSGG